jgi:hypothetical protein
MVERKSLGFSPPDRTEQRKRVLASIEQGLSEEELAEQKASFVYGNAPTRSGITKESARHAVAHARLQTNSK